MFRRCRPHTQASGPAKRKERNQNISDFSPVQARTSKCRSLLQFRNSSWPKTLVLHYSASKSGLVQARASFGKRSPSGRLLEASWLLVELKFIYSYLFLFRSFLV